MANGISGRDAAGCVGYLALALLAGFCWLAWTNRPVSLWCVGALAVGASAHGVAQSLGARKSAKGRSLAAVVRAMRNCAFGIGIATGLCWLVQIALNLLRDRTDPNAVLGVEAAFYDMAKAVDAALSPLPVVAAFAAAFAAAIASDSWAPLRWSNSLKTSLSWASAVLVGLMSVTFVSAREGAARQQFVLGPIRATVGTDLTRLRDARRRRVAAQWLVAAMGSDPRPWRLYARKGIEACSIVNDYYRAAYRRQVSFSDLPAYDADPRSRPCDQAAFARKVALAVTAPAPRSPGGSAPWMGDQRSLWGGEPDPSTQPSEGPDGEDAMLTDMESSDGPPTGPPPPSRLSEVAQELSIAEARRAAASVKAAADREAAVAEAWETVASRMLGSLAGETDADYRGVLIKTWVEALADHVAAESGDLIAKRLRLADTPTPGPRDAALLLGRLPRVAIPIATRRAVSGVKALRANLSSALAAYLPDGDTRPKLDLLAAKDVAKRAADHTGKPAPVFDADGHVIGTARPPEAWNPFPGHAPGSGGEVPPEPRPEFHAIP